ncbi:F-box domain-containing protein [Favolaschia claudopus]|uniref:F-box domain-containing protein n=1 Tax=Favolaschia claudopus TaxID=2862362 RepID=A0AAV9ZTM3_9AGAR
MLPSLAADRALLEDLDGQISELKRSIEVLRQQKSAVQQRLGAYKYPVLSLPNEIISEIFIRFLPAYPECPPSQGPRSPTFLTQICRSWRGIALSTPELWRALSLSVGLGQQLGDLWLDRAGSCPLSLEVDEFHSTNGPEAVAAMLSYLGRCEYLRLRLYESQSQLSTIQDAMSDDTMALLRHLDLEFDHDEDLVFHDVPLLRSVVLDYNAATHVVLPWTQLTSVTLREFFYSDCVSMLLKTPNLISFRLDEFSVDRPPDWDPPDVPLLHLQSLVITSMKSSSVRRSDCLSPFLAPAIRKLHIPEIMLGLHPIPALTSFVSRSGCQLEHVHVSGNRLASDHSYRTALALSSLKLLVLSEPCVSSEVEEGEEHSPSDPIHFA